MLRRGVLIAGVIGCCALGAPSLAAAAGCDPIDPSLCMYPFPNDHFTRADPTTPTGRRLALPAAGAPVNRLGLPMDLSDQNRADGFSPGNLIVTRVPGLDSQAAFERTGLVPETDIARAFAPAQPAVVIDAVTGERQPIWAEVDSNPANRGDVTLIIRPARNFAEGRRFIVALRGLKDADGNTLEPRAAFRAYRDGTASDGRKDHFEDVFARLAKAGIARDDLYLAWDFTVASQQSMAARALAMRNGAFAELGDENLGDLKVEGRTPSFVQNPDLPDELVDGLKALPIPSLPLPVSIENLDGYREYATGPTARRITGTIRVPCYLRSIGCLPGLGFNLGSDQLPHRVKGSDAYANVICTVPRSALTSAEPARVSLYGHGLLGSANEVGAGNVQAMGNEHNIVFCATDWAGMSTTDVPNVLGLLQNLSNFRSLADRSQQGFLNFMFLGRWLIHPDGAAKVAAFQGGGKPLIDGRRLFYDGNSQGAILGGGLAALAPDFERAVLGVPGMNYSTLLRRSVDFDTYAHGEIEGLKLPIGLYQNYPDELERPLILSLMQLLWDRGEANGYAQHMTDRPLPDTPGPQDPVAPGRRRPPGRERDRRGRGADDRRVRARARLRSRARVRRWSRSGASPRSATSAATGRASSIGTRARATPRRAPRKNVPNRAGSDPHGAPRSTKAARVQKSAFLRDDGDIPDVCAGKPCHADSYK